MQFYENLIADSSQEIRQILPIVNMRFDLSALINLALFSLMSHESRSRVLFLLGTQESSPSAFETTAALEQALSAQFDVGICYIAEEQILFRQGEQVELSLPASKILWPFTPLRGDQSEKSLLQVLESFQPDLIHIQHFADWPLSVVEQLCEYGKPVFVTHHDFYAITPRQDEQELSIPDRTLSAEYAENLFGIDVSDYLKRRRNTIKTSLGKVNEQILLAPHFKEAFESILSHQYCVVEDLKFLGEFLTQRYQALIEQEEHSRNA